MNPPSDSWKGDLANVGRGLLMGGADIIPGVSGGTVALILGIYRRLVTALSHFDATFLGHLKHRNWREAAAHIDLKFLISLGIGIATGVLSLAGIMTRLLGTPETRPLTFAAFFGLILASGVLVGRMVQRWTLSAGLLVAAGFAFAFYITSQAGTPLDPAAGPPYGYIFLCGVVGICAMILPGISGAFILLLLGMYAYVVDALHSVKNLARGEIPSEELMIVAIFCSGCVVGLLTFSKLLRWLLARYESATMAVLCGFMLGSLQKLWPFQTDMTPDVEKFKLKQFENYMPDAMTGQAWLALAIAIAAVIFVFVLDHLSKGTRSSNLSVHQAE